MREFENYELIEELGKGASARIYRARHKETREEVSLKVFHANLFNDTESSKRIFREMRVSAALRHNNIVSVNRVLKETDPPALVMDYIDGENLESLNWPTVWKSSCTSIVLIRLRRWL